MTSKVYKKLSPLTRLDADPFSTLISLKSNPETNSENWIFTGMGELLVTSPSVVEITAVGGSLSGLA